MLFKIDFVSVFKIEFLQPTSAFFFYFDNFYLKQHRSEDLGQNYFYFSLLKLLGNIWKLSKQKIFFLTPHVKIYKSRSCQDLENILEPLGSLFSFILQILLDFPPLFIKSIQFCNFIKPVWNIRSLGHLMDQFNLWCFDKKKSMSFVTTWKCAFFSRIENNDLTIFFKI